MAFHPVAPTTPPEPPGLLFRGTVPAATSRAPPASVATSTHMQAFDNGSCNAGPSAFFDQFDGSLGGKLTATDAMASVPTTMGTISFSDDRLQPQASLQPRALPTKCRWTEGNDELNFEDCWQATEANDQYWNTGTYWPGRNTAAATAERVAPAAPPGIKAMTSSNVRCGQGGGNSMPATRNMHLDAGTALGPTFIGKSVYAGSEVASDGLLAQAVALQQHRPMVSPNNVPPFDPCGYLPSCEAPPSCQPSFDTGVPHQSPNGVTWHSPMDLYAAPDDSTSRWLGERSNMRQQEPKNFDMNAQCMFTAPGTMVCQGPPGLEGPTFDTRAAQAHQREAAHASHLFAATRGRRNEPSEYSVNYNAHATSSACADYRSTALSARPRDTWDLAVEMAAHVFDEPTADGRSLSEHARGHAVGFRRPYTSGPYGAREHAAAAHPRPHFEVAGPVGIHDECPFRLPGEEHPERATPVPSSTDDLAIGTQVLVNLPNSCLHGLYGTVVGYDSATGNYKIEFPPDHPTSTGDSACAAVAGQTGCAHGEGTQSKDRYRVKNKALAKADAPNTPFNHTAPAQKKTERMKDKASAKSCLSDRQGGKATPAPSATEHVRGTVSAKPDAPRAKASSAAYANQKDNTSPEAPQVDADATAASSQRHSVAKGLSFEERAEIFDDLRQRVRTGLLGALHVDSGVGLSVDSSGLPVFLREHREARSSAMVGLSSPPPEAVPLPHLK